MAFAIASRLTPEAGIFTAIIGGGLVSLLWGKPRTDWRTCWSIHCHCVWNCGALWRAKSLISHSNIFVAHGSFKTGNIGQIYSSCGHFGFTNGIAVLIGLSQVKDFFGLSIDKMPAQFFQAIQTLYLAANTVNPVALSLACGSLTLILLWKMLQKHLGWLGHLPGTVVAMISATVVTALFNLPVDTIGTRFGGIPSSLPHFEWVSITWGTTQFMIAPALTLALLGAIESLLCARVADDLIHDRHESNQELMAQGIANIVTPFFGGMPTTGTIARTVTNIESGANSPAAGVVHALTLLLVVLFAVPLAKDIPLASLAAILMYVAWNMGEWKNLSISSNSDCLIG